MNKANQKYNRFDEKLGVGFGQKVDGVYLSKCDYEELLRYKYMYEDLCR